MTDTPKQVTLKSGMLLDLLTDVEDGSANEDSIELELLMARPSIDSAKLTHLFKTQDSPQTESENLSLVVGLHKQRMQTYATRYEESKNMLKSFGVVTDEPENSGIEQAINSGKPSHDFVLKFDTSQVREHSVVVIKNGTKTLEILLAGDDMPARLSELGLGVLTLLGLAQTSRYGR